MWRKITTYFVLLTFLNLTIGFDLALALSDKQNPDWTVPEQMEKVENESYTNQLLFAGGLLLGLVVLYLLIKRKGTSSPSEPPKDQTQTQGTQKSKSDLDDRHTPTGELVVVRW